MKQHFPMLAGWTRIHRIGPNTTELINELTEESFIVDKGEEYIKYITSLNEKDSPYEIPAEFTRKERSAILNELSEHIMLREDRWLNRSFGNIMYSVFIPKQHESNKQLFAILNKLIYLLFLPTLVCGFLYFHNSYTDLEGINIPGIICGIALGVLLHETGHAISTLSYGGKLYEAGLSITHILIPGAYIVSKNNDHLALQKQIQVFSAGIEMNAIIAGISFFLVPTFPQLGDFFFCIAWVNLMQMLINLIVISGNDGCQILAVLFGKGADIVDLAKEYVTTDYKREFLLKQGFTGRVTLLSYCIILLLQIATPVLLLASILEVIAWFA